MVASLQLQPFGRTAHPATLGTIEVGRVGRLMQRRIDLKDPFPDGRQVDYLFKCRDCKHNGGKDRTCIGDKRAIMCAAAPTHCPMITNLRIWPRTSTRKLCVKNFIQSHDPSNICTAADRTEVPRTHLRLPSDPDWDSYRTSFDDIENRHNHHSH